MVICPVNLSRNKKDRKDQILILPLGLKERQMQKNQIRHRDERTSNDKKASPACKGWGQNLFSILARFMKRRNAH